MKAKEIHIKIKSTNCYIQTRTKCRMKIANIMYLKIYLQLSTQATNKEFSSSSDNSVSSTSAIFISCLSMLIFIRV